MGGCVRDVCVWGRGNTGKPGERLVARAAAHSRRPRVDGQGEARRAEQPALRPEVRGSVSARPAPAPATRWADLRPWLPYWMFSPSNLIARRTESFQCELVFLGGKC